MFGSDANVTSLCFSDVLRAVIDFGAPRRSWKIQPSYLRSSDAVPKSEEEIIWLYACLR